MKPADIQRLKMLLRVVDKGSEEMDRNAARYDVLPEFLVEHRKHILKALLAYEQSQRQPELFTP